MNFNSKNNVPTRPTAPIYVAFPLSSVQVNMDSSGPEEQVSESQRGEQIHMTQSKQNQQLQMCQPQSDENVDMTQSKPDDEQPQVLVCEFQSCPDENVQLSQPHPGDNVQPSQSKPEEHISSQTDESHIDMPKSEPDDRAQLLQFQPDDDGHIEISQSQPDHTQVDVDMSLSQPVEQVCLPQLKLYGHAESPVKSSEPGRKSKEATRPTLEDIPSDPKILAVVITVIAVLVVVLTICFISLQHTTHMIGKDLSESKAATLNQLKDISVHTKALNDTKETFAVLKDGFGKMTAKFDMLKKN